MSDIFPDFFYSPLRDEKGRAISISSHPLHKPRPIQGGIKELLLCRECETRISRTETYAARILRGLLAMFEESGDEKEIAIDATRFRLFGLSLLWRAHVARHHSFAQVRLGPLEAPLRAMLLRGDPGKPHEYGFVMDRIEWGAPIKGIKGVKGQVMITPIRRRIAGLWSYFFFAYGFGWAFIASKNSDHLAGLPFVGAEPTLTVSRRVGDSRLIFATVSNVLGKRGAGLKQLRRTRGRV